MLPECVSEQYLVVNTYYIERQFTLDLNYTTCFENAPSNNKGQRSKKRSLRSVYTSGTRYNNNVFYVCHYGLNLEQCASTAKILKTELCYKRGLQSAITGIRGVLHATVIQHFTILVS